MFYVLGLILQIVAIGFGIRDEDWAGVWSWSKLVFALGFGVLEGVILIVPVAVINPNSHRPLVVYVLSCVIAALNFIWFVVVARRWKLPDGRTSVEAYRDEQAAVKEEQVRISERHDTCRRTP
jgi:phosphotransferase system  glucose/maltose/N-acetylglucosamine-specific IIC component